MSSQKNNVALMLALFLVFVLGMAFERHFVLAKQLIFPHETLVQRRGAEGLYTNHLLACETEITADEPVLQVVQSAVAAEVAVQKAMGNIDEVSVFFRDFNRGSGFTINPEERFTPASLNKVPLMITALSYAEKDSSFLNQTFTYQATKDANAVQMVKPSKTLEPGKTYTLKTALEYMIQSSDNASYDILSSYIPQADYLKMFNLLKIPTTEEKGMTSYEYSYFLRVLYNSTLLNKNSSETALKLLVESEYDRGIEAGVPEGIEVANKFGISGGVDEQGNPINRQLHDCGIVYFPENTYLICIMTKSSAELEQIETAISQISAVAYDQFSSSLKSFD